MALAKKGTREIVVEGHAYRWATSAANIPDRLEIIVEHYDTPGQRLVPWLDYPGAVTPSLIREVVLRGLAVGWCPREPGPELRVRLPRT